MSKHLDLEKALEEAIANNDVEAVEELLTKFLKKKPKLIFQAIENADSSLVRKLLDSGVSLEERYFGGTPLLNTVFELTELDGYMNMDDEKRRNIERMHPELRPIDDPEGKKKRLIEIFHLLIERGSDVNVKAPDGTSVLKLASTLSYSEIADALLSMGAQHK